MHHANDGLERGGIGRRQDAVAEIEDMPRVAAGAPQHLSRAAHRDVDARETARRIEVALDRAPADTSSPLVELNVPVDADDGAVGRTHEVEEFTRADAEQDRGHAQ